MLITPLIIALIYIGTGFLVKKQPKSIAGYEKILKSVNGELKLKKAANILCNNLIICSIFTIIGCYVGYYFDWKTVYILSLILPCLLALIISITRINRDNR
jgi:hypothetical protein